MSCQCEYCKEILSSVKALRVHQSTTKYCLDIQKSRGMEIKIPEYKCKCGSIYTKKGNLARHAKVCQSASLIVNGDHNTINQNITNNITVNQTIIPAKPFTMRDLTREYILARLTPVITKEIVKSGLGAITELVVEVLLQRDGKYCYYCADPSRKKFIMVIDHQGQVIEEKDPNSQFLRSLLSIPLQTIVATIAQLHTIKAVQNTLEDVKELKRDGAAFSSTLASSLPRSPDGIPECLKDMIDQEADNIALKHLNEIDQKTKVTALKKKMLDENPYLA